MPQRKKKRSFSVMAETTPRRLSLTRASLNVKSPLATDNSKPLRLHSIEDIRARDKYLRDEFKAIDEQLYGGPNYITNRSSG